MTRCVWGVIVLFIIILLNNHFCFFAINILGPSDEGPIRIMTYNTNGIHGEYKDKEFLTSFLEKIDSLNPRILVLQEMYYHYSTTLCKELKNRYQYNSFLELAKQKNEDKNVACIFSSYPIKSLYRYKFNREEIDSIYNQFTVLDSVKRPVNADIFNAVLDIEGQETLVVCCYLKTNDYSKLRQKHSDSWYDGIDDYFSGYRVGSAIRTHNAKMIRDSIAKYNLPAIVCGDMNDFQSSHAICLMMDDDMKNVWWERGFGYGMTYNRFHLMLRIDHILISEEFDAVKVEVPHMPFSDHYPIVADLKFKGND